VFCNPSGEWLWRTTFVERFWRPACDGSPQRGWEPILPGFRFHDQRHTHRTWMKEDAIADPLAYERLGHKMPGIEAVYDHPTDRMRPALMTALQRRWDDSGSFW
jgi:integrase